MSCDKLVYDLASETEGSPNVFVRKDWLNILDNQNQNYTNNQSIVDTSQLSNSNKWLSYREAYFEIPLLLSMGSSVVGTGQAGQPGFIGYDPVTANSSANKVVGLKSWFGQIIHSFTLDYNGTTIVQQTPFIQMWNSFKLLTTLSHQELVSLGPHIGFYPDDSKGWQFNTIPRAAGVGTCNNGNFGLTHFFSPFTGTSSRLDAGDLFNTGFTQRQSWISYDPYAKIGSIAGPADTSADAQIITQATSSAMWRSYVFGRAGAAGAGGLIQMAIMATVYLKHVHSFFNMVPLLKGVYMKMTMNLNNCSTSITTTASVPAAAGPPAVAYTPGTMTLTSVSNPVGGVVPILISSSYGKEPAPAAASVGQMTVYSAGSPITLGNGPQVLWANLSVGATITDPTAFAALTVAGTAPGTGGVARSIYLYVPAYTFNPVFEQAYLSSPVKTIKYTDVYQYQVQSVSAGSAFNVLITNGIANIKSVLVIPFFAGTVAASGLPIAVPVYQSPFDTAGCGTCSPLIQLNNFNVVISGQNAIYNTERYTFEHFVNQTYGVNAVNGGLTDGLSSGLIGFDDWMSCYGYYYTNVERMLPVEQSVPKSVQLQGVNATLRELSFWVFVEYGAQIQIDAITGARV